jgi:hypothetical protein
VRGNAWWVNAVVLLMANAAMAVMLLHMRRVETFRREGRGGGILPSPPLSSSIPQRLRFIGSVLQAESMAVTERVQV